MMYMYIYIYSYSPSNVIKLQYIHIFTKSKTSEKMNDLHQHSYPLVLLLQPMFCAQSVGQSEFEKYSPHKIT